MQALEVLNRPAKWGLYEAFMLENDGHLFMEGKDLKELLGISENDWSRFQEHWNGLPMDPFMADGGTYRLRRFGVFHFDPAFLRLEYQGNQAFLQDRKHNVLNGGIVRKFAGLEEDFAADPLLARLIRQDISLLPPSVRSQKLKVYVHQIRIVAGNSYCGHPTPEGIHQDGHLFVAQHLIARKNISGGDSTVYDLEKRPLFSIVLSRGLDTLMVNDPRVFHSVSPISAGPGAGSRDMLLIDFNFMSEV